MVVFNPEVAPGQDKMPSFLKGYSEPITQPKADESGEYLGKASGIALSTAGKGIEGVAELGDSFVKGVIKNDVYSRVDPLTDGYITALKQIKDNPTGLGPAAPVSDASNTETGATETPVNIMAGPDDPNMPKGLQAGLKNIQRLGAAAASGKPSNTEIDMKLYKELKDLRATYPGWREYVDATMQKATGKDIANELVNSLRSDIAKQLANQDKEQTFWQHTIVSNSGFPEADKMLQYYKQTGDSNKVMQWLSFNQGQIQALALKKAQFESQGQDEKTNSKNATDYANAAANHAATIAFSNQQMFGGVSPADIADKMADLTLHPEKANDAAYQNLGAQYEAARAKTITQTSMLLNQRPKLPDGTLGKSVADILGPEATRSIVKSSVGALFDATSEMIKDKQFSPAYMLNQQAEAVQSNALHKVLTNNTIGGKVAAASAINKLMPTFAPVIAGKLLGNGLDSDLSTLVQAQGINAITNQGGKYMGQDGKIYSFKQSIEELGNAQNIRGEKLPGQVYNNLLEIRRAITDPMTTPEGKKNAINYFYDPVNKGVMENFMNDYYDPTQGRMVKGRSSAFAALTSTDVTKNIRSFSEAYDPSAWNKYSNWAKGEAAGLIRNSVGDLNDAVNNAGKWNPKISWDSENKRLKIQNYNGTELEGLAATSLNIAYRTVQNLNDVMGNLANIAKTEGTNVDAYVFKVLKDSGFSPNQNVDGVPAQIMRAMISGNGYKVRDLPKGKISQFAPEPRPDTLQEFIKNPTGSQTNEPLESYQTRGVIKGNLSDEPIMGMRTDEIPPGMSPSEYLRQLKSAGR